MDTLKNLIRSAYYAVGGVPGMDLLVRPWRGTGAILCYHRVLPRKQMVSDSSPNRSLVVSLERFEEQVRTLSENCQVVSMDEILSHTRRSTGAFVVAVTFDDGYRDNLEHALPILQKYKVPATIYMTTRFLVGDTTMWWRELWELLQSSYEFSVILHGKPKSWKIGSRRLKIQCFKDLRHLLLNGSKESFLDLSEQFKTGGSSRNYGDLCLSMEDILELAKGGLVTIGSHTHNHYSLAKLKDYEVLEEYIQSKKILEEVIGKPVRHLAYPYGTRQEAGRREYLLAKEAGFDTGVTTVNGGIFPGSNPLALPRLEVRDHVTSKRLGILLSGFAGMLGRGL